MSTWSIDDKKNSLLQSTAPSLTDRAGSDSSDSDGYVKLEGEPTETTQERTATTTTASTAGTAPEKAAAKDPAAGAGTEAASATASTSTEGKAENAIVDPPPAEDATNGGCYFLEQEIADFAETCAGGGDFQCSDLLSFEVYPQRWIQLTYVSLLSGLSDWVCFAYASVPHVFYAAYDGKTSEGLILIFLLVNIVGCAACTDIVAKYGLQKCTKWGSLLMAVGCWFRSGLGIFTLGDDQEVNLPSYASVVFGTVLVALAQPFFQCTPPLLSAQWFASNERATASAIALNFNEIGIAAAFLVAVAVAGDDLSHDGDDDGHDDATYHGLNRYNVVVAILATVTSIGTFLQFKEKPPGPPSASEYEKLQSEEHVEPPFHVSCKKFFSTPGFMQPLAAFMCSITIINVVGAFVEAYLERGGINNHKHIAWYGTLFEFTLVTGGIVIGKYVDETKEYRRVTKACILLSLIFLLPLGLEERRVGKEPVLLVVSLLILGFFVGPIRPVSAELAVEVTYPGDETAVESVQQLGGKVLSAIFVPLVARASRLNYEILPDVRLFAADIPGDIVALMAVTALTYWYYRSFNAPLLRTLAESRIVQGSAKEEKV